MNDRFERQKINIRVGKLANSPAIHRVCRLDLEHLPSQLDSPQPAAPQPAAPSFKQRLRKAMGD